MTTAGFMSGTRGETSPTHLSRLAAASSLLHGVALVWVLPAATAAAFYVGVLGASFAALAILSGSVLWSRATLCVRGAAALSAGATLTVALLQAAAGLPGAGRLAHLDPVDLVVVGGFAAVVLAFLMLDARRRHPEQAPDHPYAL